MPLTAQETRCVDLACVHLGALHGGTWRVTQSLDDENPSTASPEVEASNGTATAAIEVKRLTVAELERYHNWKPSLERYLSPSCPGHFFLMPCINFTLPLKKPMMKHLRSEVARVARTLPPESSGPVLIPRDGYVVKLNGNLPGRIWCTAHNAAEDLSELGARLDGWYYLIHDNPWDHNFMTDAGRAAWYDSIVAGCANPTIEGRFSWNEEWELRRLDDGEDDERHFEVLAISDVFTGGSADAAVWTMLERGRAKFHQRWADHHILVFESMVPMINAERLAGIAAEFDADDLGAVEMILLVDGERLAQIWPSAR
jgi:hypothetical protein